MSRHSSWDDSDQERQVLSFEEADSRAEKAADMMLMAIQDSELENTDELREYFASQCFSFLAENFTIGAPAPVTQE